MLAGEKESRSVGETFCQLFNFQFNNTPRITYPTRKNYELSALKSFRLSHVQLQ